MEHASTNLSDQSEQSTREPSAYVFAQLNFPSKLNQILSTPEYNDIICWLPHGRSWRVLQQQRFVDEVLPVFFRHANYSSFIRQVNGWGFRRVQSGPGFNSYYHESFRRDDDSYRSMRRPTAKELAERKQALPKDPPDFDQIPPTSKTDEFLLDRASSPPMSLEQHKEMLIRRLSTYSSLTERNVHLQMELNRLSNKKIQILQRLRALAGDEYNVPRGRQIQNISNPLSAIPPLQRAIPHVSINNPNIGGATGVITVTMAWEQYLRDQSFGFFGPPVVPPRSASEDHSRPPSGAYNSGA